MDDYGEKHIWVEFEDDKGFRIRSQATVAYENLDSRPAATSPPAAQPTILQMDYDTNTFTLQVDSSFSAVRLQEVYFTWEDERFAYEIELAGDLADVDLEAFDSDACLLIYFGPAPTDTTMPGCETVYPVSFTGFDAPLLELQHLHCAEWAKPAGNLPGRCGELPDRTPIMSHKTKQGWSADWPPRLNHVT